MYLGIQYTPLSGPFTGMNMTYGQFYGLPCIYTDRLKTMLRCSELSSLLHGTARPCSLAIALGNCRNIVEYYSGHRIQGLVISSGKFEAAKSGPGFILNPNKTRHDGEKHKTFKQLLPRLLGDRARILLSPTLKMKVEGIGIDGYNAAILDVLPAISVSI